MNLNGEVKESYKPIEFADMCSEHGGGLNEGYFAGLTSKNIDNSIPELKEALEEFDKIFLSYEEAYFYYQKAIETIYDLFRDKNIEFDD